MIAAQGEACTRDDYRSRGRLRHRRRGLLSRGSVAGQVLSLCLGLLICQVYTPQLREVR